MRYVYMFDYTDRQTNKDRQTNIRTDQIAAIPLPRFCKVGRATEKIPSLLRSPNYKGHNLPVSYST